ncbi:MAG: radical SAM protein [Clostridia bacterium]|nr:radical SAM protein [Clostridia bacterium]
MERYSVIQEKNPREIVLLRGGGCAYKACTFCDYYADSGPDVAENYRINRDALSRVRGLYGKLEVINSGSVFELDSGTQALILQVCREKNINIIHFESHYLYRKQIPALRKAFADFDLKMKLGLETFDHAFRERVLKKGIRETDPAVISRDFDEANFLFGIRGQTLESMQKDISLGLRYFERICLNVMCGNSTGVKPDREVVDAFVSRLYPLYKDNDRVDILLNNTDFGVGD